MLELDEEITMTMQERLNQIAETSAERALVARWLAVGSQSGAQRRCTRLKARA